MILISRLIALLLDREFNRSRKCLEVPIRKKLDSRNIRRIQYFILIDHMNFLLLNRDLLCYYTDIDRTVMKYHVSVDCQESYIFPRDYRENIVPRENITLFAPPHVIFHPSRSIYVILDGQNEWFHGNCMCSMTTTKFGNKTRSLRTKQTERKFDRYARVLLWRSIVNHCVVWLRGAFLSGSVS